MGVKDGIIEVFIDGLMDGVADVGASEGSVVGIKTELIAKVSWTLFYLIMH